MIEAQNASKRYVIDGTTYDVPRANQFGGAGNFDFPGLDKEPTDSVWLTFSADEMSGSVPGYSRTVRGYRGQVDADLTVNVLGGKEAREFPQDFAEASRAVQKLSRSRAPTAPDAKTGMTRIVEMEMARGSSWYLLPPAGQTAATDRLPPACKSSKDSEERDLYDCQFTVQRNGRSFVFSLNEENMRFADDVVDFVARRLTEWQHK